MNQKLENAIHHGLSCPVPATLEAHGDRLWLVVNGFRVDLLEIVREEIARALAPPAPAPVAKPFKHARGWLAD